MAQDTSKMLVDVGAPVEQLNLGGTSNIWRKKSLLDKTIPQSIAIDYKANPQQLYVIQCRIGSTDGGQRTGELIINKLDKNGNQTSTKGASAGGLQMRHYHDSSGEYYTEESEWDYRQLCHYEKNGLGFGHGTQGAIEYAPDGTYLWVDVNSPVIKRDITPASAQWDVVGIQLCRVKYVDGKIVTPKSADVQILSNAKLNLPSGAFGTGTSYHTVSIDNHNKILAVKYLDHRDGFMYVSAYKYSYPSGYNNHCSSMTFSHLGTFKPELMAWWFARRDGSCSSKQTLLVPNGWAVFGDYVYLGYGTGYWNHIDNLTNQPADSHPIGQYKYFCPTPEMVAQGNLTYYDGTKVTKAGNTHIRCYNYKTGKMVWETFTEGGKSLPWRELEGLHVVPTVSNGIVTKVKLCFCFACEGSGDRSITVLTKENAVPNVQV